MEIRVLLIEDNPGDARLLREMLAQATSAQFELTHIERLGEALQRLDKTVFDLILLDLSLPDSQGFETFAQLYGQAPGAPIIVLSGLDDEALAVRAVREGAQDYLVKGQVDGNLLVRAMRYAIERKRAQDALRKSEARYRAVVEDQTELICRFLPGRMLIFANEAYQRYFGQEGESLTDYDFMSHIFHRDRQMVENHIVSLDRHSPVKMIRHRVVKPDGEVRWQQWINRAIFDEQGRLTEYQSVGRDITLRVQVEERLRRRNRELTLLNRVGQELSATLDLQELANQLLQEGAEIVGAEASSVWLWERERGNALICQAAFPHVYESLLRSQYLHFGQGIVGWVAKTGKSLIVSHAADDPRFFPGIDEQTGFHTRSLLAVPLKVRDVVVGVLEVLNKQKGHFSQDDLTLVETLASSAAIAVVNARLIEELRQHTSELEARNEELDAFAHTVAHDLKSPLSYIVSFAEILKQGYDPRQEQDLGYLQKIAKKGRKMAFIIDELLLLAGVRKIEELDIAPLDMANVVAQVLERMSDVIQESQAEIILPPSWPAALGYGSWVEEVWVNYLSNAIKYGGQPPRVELGSDLVSRDQWLAASRQKLLSPNHHSSPADYRPLVRFWVRDNGPGLTPDEQERLFTPFTRLNQVSTKGHGLGLSIVRRIVEKLGGQVGVESEVGEGSVFSFTLPAAPTSNEECIE
ncbi:MAG: GAF domain-containing protein [Anaerolineae bacterium]|jgi:PAS domain S-box-containing protein